MPIQRILLISFFLILLIIVLPLSTLSFLGFKNSFQAEIGRNLSNDATLLMDKIDILMFERLQNVHSWSHMDVIQEARVGDVDKRLSQFLSNLQLGYKGMYRNLFYTDTQQKVIAASNTELMARIHYKAANWITATVPNGEVIIEDLQLIPPYDQANLVIRAPVLDNYATHEIASNQPMGHLYGLFDMQQLFNILDKASNSGERFIVLLDNEGRTIAASANLRQPQFLLKNDFANWKPHDASNFFIHAGAPIEHLPLLIGYARSDGYLGFAQMGWSLLIMQTTDKAFLPTRTLWNTLSIMIIMLLLLGILISYWLSGHLAKPLLKLTQWVRNVPRFTLQTPPNVGGTIEVRELEKAFIEMLDELEQSRKQLVQASKLAVVGEMAAIMAHEVRTPLGILSTSAQWLQSEKTLSPEGQEMTQFILEESARLRKLVTTLLECARPRAPQMQPYNIHHLISRTIDLLATQTHHKKIDIQQQFQATDPVIVCDHELLTQVFLNLLLNAIQILPEKGIIRIQTVSFTSYFSIEIADNGQGIASADFVHLFDPFFTKREGGVGLGLTVTQQIITAHQGKITAKPSDWGGACFVLHLPIQQE